MENVVSTELARKKRAAYMREWREKNLEKVQAQTRDRLAKKKALDPDGYAEFRKQRNEANKRYAESHKEFLKEKWTKRNRAIYTPEVGKLLRSKYNMRYSTKVSMKSAKKRADEKGMPFDLTPEWYEAEFDKGCAVTGLALDRNGSKTPWTAHVDRIVPALGYIQTNCRLVCASYNLAKKHWRDEDVLKMAIALVNKSKADAEP